MKFSKLYDMFFLGRPVLLIPVWAFFIFGYYHGNQTVHNNEYSFLFTLPLLKNNVELIYWLKIKTILTIFAFSLLMAGVHIINQIADIEADKKNSGFPLLAKGILSKKTAIIESVILFVIAIIIEFFVNNSAIVMILFISAIILGYIYSMPPIRLSGKPILDFLSNATGYGLITFFLGWICSNNTDYKDMLVNALPYFFMMASGSIASTIPDIKGDKEDGKNTTCVYLGIRPACILAIISLIASFVIGWQTRNFIAIVISFISLFPFFVIAVNPVSKNSAYAYQIGGGLLILVGLILCIPFFIISILLALSTKVYFKIRHNVNYPQMGQ